MKLAHIEICNAVLLTGSVTGAARLLHLSQPAVTKMLQSAENQFGFKLFARDKNRLVPTQEALDLHPEIQEIASRIDQLREFTKALAQDRTTVLRVDCPPSIAAALIPMCLERFAQLYPKVSVQVETHIHLDIVRRLTRRQSDVGLSLATLPNPAIMEETIASGTAVCVVPHSMAAQMPAAVTVKALSRCPVISVPAGGPLNGGLLDSLVGEPNQRRGSLTVSTNYLAMRMAERGLGVAAIDSFTAALVDRNKARIVPFEPETPVQIYALRAYRAKPTHQAQRFVEILADVAREAHQSLDF